MTTVTVGIIAANEAEMIGGCLSLLQWADEIIVLVDDRSTDDTAGIARSAGATVHVEPWRGFAAQRNRLAELATGDWLLYVDADERVTHQLAEEVRRTLDSSEMAAYSIKTQNVFLGRPMLHGAWWPDPHLRLVQRAKLRGWDGLLHETPILDGPAGALEAPFVHLGHRDLPAMLVKTAQWAPLDARRRTEGPYPRVRLRSFASAIAREVGRRLIRGQAWRDGIEGWIETLYQSFSSFMTVAVAWQLQRREPLEETYRRLDAHLHEGGSLEDFFGRR